jgi:hypothetical protein
MAFLTVTDAAQLLRMEYLEMPGLALTAWQAQRLVICLVNYARELFVRFSSRAS